MDSDTYNGNLTNEQQSLLEVFLEDSKHERDADGNLSEFDLDNHFKWYEENIKS